MLAKDPGKLKYIFFFLQLEVFDVRKLFAIHAHSPIEHIRLSPIMKIPRFLPSHFFSFCYLGRVRCSLMHADTISIVEMLNVYTSGERVIRHKSLTIARLKTAGLSGRSAARGH